MTAPEISPMDPETYWARINERIERYDQEATRFLDRALDLAQWLPDHRALRDGAETGEPLSGDLRAQTVIALTALSRLARDEAGRLRAWSVRVRRSQLAGPQAAPNRPQPANHG